MLALQHANTPPAPLLLPALVLTEYNVLGNRDCSKIIPGCQEPAKCLEPAIALFLHLGHFSIIQFRRAILGLIDHEKPRGARAFAFLTCR